MFFPHLVFFFFFHVFTTNRTPSTPTGGRWNSALLGTTPRKVKE